MAAFYPAAGRAFEAYEGFPNAYADGHATIARLVGPAISDSMGCGVARYERVRTTWNLPFDELVLVLSGAMVARAAGQEWAVGPGDLLFFRRDEPFEYDVAETITVFYAKHPA